MQQQIHRERHTKNIGAMQSRFDPKYIKGWLIGAICGVFLSIGLVVGTGHLNLNRTQNAQPVSAVQQAPLISGEGAVPPPIDEMQQYRVFEPAVLSRAELVPPIDEVQQYRRALQAAQAGQGLVPPPLDEFQRLHHVESPDEIGVAAPAPAMPGDTRY